MRDVVAVFVVAGLVIGAVVLMSFAANKDLSRRCYDNPYDGFSFESDIDPAICAEITKKNFDAYDAIQTAAASVGCTSHNRERGTFDCNVGIHHYVYQELPGTKHVWWFVETADSKFCSPYFEKPVPEVPLRCYDYFDLKKP